MGIKFNPIIFEGLDITGGSDLAIGSPIAGADGDSILVTDATGKLAEIALENGELLIGSTGAAPVATTLTGTTDQVTITNGVGSVVISTPQNIAPTSNVTFNSITTNTIDADGVLTLGAIDATVINIGNPASIVNLQGDVNIINTTNLDVTNSLINLNVGGPVASGAGSGIEVEEDALTAGYVKVAADRESWQLKSPARVGTVNIQAPTTGNLLINQELFDSKYDASNPNGYETPAQLDARDTANRDRANHTGTQLSTTISDFTEASQDAVGAAIAAGVQDGVTLTYDDVNDRIDVSNIDKGSTAVTAHELAADPHPQYETSAEAQAKVDAHANLTNNPHSVTKAQVGLGNADDTSDLDKPISTDTQAALDLKYNASNPNGYETPAQLDARDTANRDRANHTGTQLSSTISDFEEATQDSSALMITTATHDGVSVSYNDAANTLSFTNTDKGSVEVGLHEAAANPHPQYATTELDNLTTTSINANLIPDGNSTRSVGSAANNWNTINTRTIQSNDALTVTSGDTSASSTGTVTVNSKDLPVTGVTGDVIINSGTQSNAAGASGNVTIVSGSAVSSTGLVLIGSSSGGGNTGSVSISTGNGTGTSGSITISTGTAPTRGDISFNANSISSNGTRLTNVGAPTNSNDAATKAYVDAAILIGEIASATQTLNENAVNTVVVGYTLNPALRYVDLLASVQIDATTDLAQSFRISCVYVDGAWVLFTETLGDDTLVTFSVDVSNNLVYSSSSYAGFVSGSIRLRGFTL